MPPLSAPSKTMQVFDSSGKEVKTKQTNLLKAHGFKVGMDVAIKGAKTTPLRIKSCDSGSVVLEGEKEIVINIDKFLSSWRPYQEDSMDGREEGRSAWWVAWSMW